MSILVNNNSRVVVQGITGKEGAFHTRQMVEYGTNIVAGVTPGKGGITTLRDIPVFDLVEEPVRKFGADTSIIFVPPAFAADAIIESNTDFCVELKVDNCSVGSSNSNELSRAFFIPTMHCNALYSDTQ